MDAGVCSKLIPERPALESNPEPSCTVRDALALPSTNNIDEGT